MSAFAAAPEALVAHRGVGSEALQHELGIGEGSLTALGWAIANDADYVDLDVRNTYTKNFVTMHDDLLTRTTNCNGKYVSKLSSTQVQACVIELPDRNGDGNGTNTADKVPTLTQALKYIKSRSISVKICLEMKGAGWSMTQVQKLKDQLKAQGLFSSRVNVHSFDKTPLGYAKSLGFPNTGYVVGANDPVPSNTETLKWGNTLFLRYNALGLTPELVQSYHDAGITTFGFTVETPDEIERAVAMGFKVLVTDDLRATQEFLEEAS